MNYNLAFPKNRANLERLEMREGFCVVYFFDEIYLLLGKVNFSALLTLFSNYYDKVGQITIVCRDLDIYNAILQIENISKLDQLTILKPSESYIICSDLVTLILEQCERFNQKTPSKPNKSTKIKI